MASKKPTLERGVGVRESSPCRRPHAAICYNHPREARHMYLRPTPRKPPSKLRWVWVALSAAYLSVGLLFFAREKGIAPALVSATPTPSETLEQRLEKGDQAFAAGNMSSA